MIKFARLLTQILCFLLMVSSSALQAREFTMFFHNDVLGSPVLATDSAGNVLGRENYSPFGERQIKDPAASGNTLWFTGKPQNESSGLSYFGARYYSPELGQFMSIDPVAPVIGNIHHFNRYAYANNNPSKYIDPDGRYADLVIEGASIGVGVASLGSNLWNGNYGDAGIDALGIIGDGLLAVVPGIPGGIGLSIKGSRYADEVANTAESVADAAFAAGKKSGAAAELRVGDKVYTAVSGEIVKPNDKLTGILMGNRGKRADWHGGCAEIACLDKALNDGVDVSG